MIQTTHYAYNHAEIADTVSVTTGSICGLQEDSNTEGVAAFADILSQKVDKYVKK